MEHTFFEAPEYPVLERFKKCAVIFVKQAIGLLAVLLLVRIAEIGFGSHMLKPKESLIVLIIEGIIYTSIYFLKALPFLFLIALICFFSNFGETTLRICNYIVFSLFLSFEIVLAKYFYSTKVLLGSDVLVSARNLLPKLFSVDIYWLVANVLALLMLWFAMRFSKLIEFVDSVYALSIIAIGIVLLFFEISALPNDDGTENFKIKVSKSAYIVDKVYSDLFDKEPVVDIYDQNYFD
jgi:hypothetical protein